MRPSPSRLASIQVVLALVAFVAAWVLVFLRVDPVPTWFYVFAWYPTLAALDGIARRIDGRPSMLFGQPAVTLSLFAWSPALWLVFEAANLRLENWYYVFLPAHITERWIGILLSFATVLPAIVLSERVLAAFGIFAHGGHRQVSIREWELRAGAGIAVAAAALVFLWPRVFFPLVWGVGLFLCEPLVYRRARHLSLLHDLERGDWGRVGRLVLGGLGIGFLWEAYNHVAEGSWIYTVPGLERIKLFEMPPLGFLGFPVFALAAWAMYSALCALGVALPVSAGRIVRGRTAVAALVAATFAGATLVGMERCTISSSAPTLADVPGLSATDITTLRSAGLDTPRAVAAADPAELERRTSLDAERARGAVAATRLVMLRGIGTTHAAALHALGISRVCDLVGRDPTTLARALRALRPGHRPTTAEVRVWTRGAERRCH